MQPSANDNLAPQDIRMDINNQIRDLALETHMQGKLLEQLEPAKALLLHGQAQGMLLACNIVLGDLR